MFMQIENLTFDLQIYNIPSNYNNKKKFLYCILRIISSLELQYSQPLINQIIHRLRDLHLVYHQQTQS